MAAARSLALEAQKSRGPGGRCRSSGRRWSAGPKPAAEWNHQGALPRGVQGQVRERPHLPGATPSRQELRAAGRAMHLEACGLRSELACGEALAVDADGPRDGGRLHWPRAPQAVQLSATGLAAGTKTQIEVRDVMPRRRCPSRGWHLLLRAAVLPEAHWRPRPVWRKPRGDRRGRGGDARRAHRRCAAALGRASDGDEAPRTDCCGNPRRCRLSQGPKRGLPLQR